MDLSDLRVIIDAHATFWASQRQTLRAYTRVYETEMWGEDERRRYSDLSVTVETSNGYAYIESYVASLFARRPAVAVASGPEETGDPHLAEGLANRFLDKQVESVEDLVRFALIYPFCGVKLGHIARHKVIDQIDLQVIKPWDMIVDMDASRWDLQRYVGHRYWMPLPAAAKKWGRKRWKAATRVDYLDDKALPTGLRSAPGGTGPGGTPREAARTVISSGDNKRSAMLSYVEIYEVYDLVEDEMVIYSPSLDTNEGIVERVSPIPVRNADGGPMAPIYGLYMSHGAHVPLRGASAMKRVYDQLYEINQLRTHWANSVRREARLYVSRKGTLDESAKAALTANIDQSIIEVELPAEQAVGTAIQPLSSQTMSVDYTRYKDDIQADLDRGSVLAPFTRGVATNATATEISALSQYTSTEVGRMARRRDLAVEFIAECYVLMTKTLLADTPDDRTAVTIDGKRVILSADALEGSFRYAAADQSSTPISSAVRRQRILELIPVLTALGVPNPKLLSHLQREFDLPAEFLDTEEAAAPVALPSGEAVPSSDGAQAPLPIGGGDVAQEIRAGGPGAAPIPTDV